MAKPLIEFKKSKINRLFKTLTASLAITFLLFLTSCGVPKNFQHAQYLQDSVTAAEKQIINKPAIIEPGDRLSINITATNKEAAQEFNITTATSGGASGGASAGGVSASPLTYLVDTTGNILLLQLGKVKAAGLTTTQLQANLQDTLTNFIKGPIVTVSISNFKVNVFGEVARPGVIIVPDGKMNILEAIIQSGDLTTFGIRTNILVIREDSGHREFGRVNINSNHIFESPYYNLKQNDMIYVEADKTKYINNNPVLERDLRNLGIATTLLTTLILVISLVKK